MTLWLRRVITLAAAVTVLAGVPAAPGTAGPSPPPSTEAATLAAAEASAVGIACVATWSCTPSHGGAFMRTARNSCTAGLPVRSRHTGGWYVLTAGHCVAKAGGATWRQSGRTLGRGTRWEYGTAGPEGRAGGGDVGFIRITANAGLWRARSRVLVLTARGARSQPIRVVRTARVGERVCVTAGRSAVTRCGIVDAASTSLRYASPGLAARTVGNLARVRGICLQPGDSGSPVFAGSAVVGIAVAKSYSGCWLWYTRIATPLRHYGVSVVPG